MGNTADAYFTPALSGICVKFKIPYQVAGVTFLAFGNGAPDVFASVTAFTGGQDVLIGIGALLGATVFISSVVVAVIVIINPCRVDPYTFKRDVICHILAVFLMGIVAIQKQVSVFMSWMFMILYALYVGVVVVGWYLERQLTDEAGGVCQEMEEVVEGGVNAAFWHSSSSTSRNSVNGGSSGGGMSTPGGYSFLFLGDTSLHGLGNKKNQNDVNKHSIGEGGFGSDSSSDDEDVVVNLSGGLITPKFNHAILEDHFGTPSNIKEDKRLNGTKIDNNTRANHFELSSHHGQSETMDISSKMSLDGSEHSRHSSMTSDGSLENDLEAPLLRFAESGHGDVSGSHALIASARDMMATNLYWQQWRLKRRVRQAVITAEWWEYPWYWKAFAVINFPFNFLRDVSIPTVDEELWSKEYCTVQPICSPLLLLYTFGLWNTSIGFFSAPVICCLVGIPLSVAVYVLTHASRPPSGNTLSTIWTFAAFTMCVVWIYFFAGELVACLEAIGTLSGIPPGVLGLTILAWGNSVGDLFANMAVAKQGLGEMAIAGSYGGPVLNLCLGLGFSFIYASSSTSPEPFPLTLDISSVVSILFALIILVATLVLVMLNHYEMSPTLGYILLGMYAIYTLIQLIGLKFSMNS